MNSDPTPFTPLTELVQQIAAKSSKPSSEPVTLESLDLVPMIGGASSRRYFRLTLPSGRSAVAMYVPDGGKAEEIQKDGKDGKGAARWPFLEVRDLLHSRGVTVPVLLGEDTARGWLVLEDLGDDTLANYLMRRPEEKTALYTRAVTDLAKAQVALAALPDESVVATRSFDEDLLRWEIDHFREWGLDARGLTLSADDRASFDAIADRLAKRIASWPRGFVHRDYQSRNLMIKDVDGVAIAWIDFQDALLGPRVYDLVALLNDSYQEFDRAFVEKRLDEFAEAHGYDKTTREELGLEFDLVTVQRKLKDAGRFVFIERVKGNPSFLQFVEPTIAKARGALERLASKDKDMKALGELLTRVLAGSPQKNK